MAVAVTEIARANFDDVGSTDVMTLSASVAVGDEMVLFGGQKNTSTHPAQGEVTDSGGNTWTKQDSTGMTGVSYSFRNFEFDAPCTAAMTSGVGTITVSTWDYRAMVAAKVSGISAWGGLDGAIVTGQNTNTSPATGSATTTQNDEVLFATLIWGATGGIPSLSAEPSGWTAIGAQQDFLSAGANLSIKAYYKIQTATGSQSASWTLGSTGDWLAILYCYKITPVMPGKIDIPVVATFPKPLLAHAYDRRA